jgi:Protein of unknown function (DUF2752)
MSQVAVGHRHSELCREHTPFLRNSIVLELPIVGRVAGVVVALLAMIPFVPGYPGVTCPLRALTGVPCPFCGTTTSFKELLQLDIAGSLAANPIGLLSVIAIASIVFSKRRRLRVPILLLIGLASILWVFELHRFALVG